MSPDDYIAPSNPVVKFLACEKSNCVSITIVNDNEQENTDTFDITLERSPDLNSNIRLGTVHGVIEITDDYYSQ